MRSKVSLGTTFPPSGLWPQGLLPSGLWSNLSLFHFSSTALMVGFETQTMKAATLVNASDCIS